MILKGGYFMIDLTAVVAGGGSTVSVDGIWDTMERVKGKPVLVTFYDGGAGNTQSAWFSLYKTDATQYDLVGSVIDVQNLTTLAVDFTIFSDDTAGVAFEEKE